VTNQILKKLVKAVVVVNVIANNNQLYFNIGWSINIFCFLIFKVKLLSVKYQPT
jgi:hypothetical protein